MTDTLDSTAGPTDATASRPSTTTSTSTATTGAVATDGAPTRRPGLTRPIPRIVIVMLAAVLAQLALVASFTSVLSNPRVRTAEVGMVAQGPAAGVPLPGVTYRPLPNAATARRLVADGSLPAALVVDGRTETLYLEGAAGPTLTTAIEAEVGAAAHKTASPLAVHDLRPVPASDPRELGTYLLVFGWVIGGYLGTMLLSRSLGARTRTPGGTLTLLGCALAYALLSAAAGVLLIDPVLGVLTGTPAELIGAGTMIVFTVSTFTAALMSLFRLPGLIVAVATLVILGNPTSGGMLPVQMMTGGFRFLATILPNHAGVSFVRSLAYLHGDQMTDPLVVLSIYVGISVLVLIGLALGRAAGQWKAAA